VLVEYPIELSSLRYMDGWTLLHFAVGQNDYSTAQTLLHFGIDVDLATAGMMRTALHEASFGNKAELVRLLVEWGAEPNLLDADRNTAIHFAVDYGYEDIVRMILKSATAVDLHIRNCMNMTTFNTCRNPDIFELLFDYESKTQKGSVISR
jgi:ankyrin repeat/SOCS box protein 8